MGQAKARGSYEAIRNGVIIRHFKKGDRVDEISTAGEPFTQIEAFGIQADFFDVGAYMQCPLIKSRKPGGGKLDEFLARASKLLPKPIAFVSIVNQRLRAHLTRLGYRILDEEEKSL